MTAMNDTSEMNAYLIALANSPNVRVWRHDFAQLSRPEQIFRLVWELEAEVNNGGFHQYFYNSSGGLVPYVGDALRAIGALAMANIVDCAIHTAGADIPWHDEAARRTKLKTLGPQVEAQLDSMSRKFCKYPDDLLAVLYRYAHQHQSEIEQARSAD